MKPRSVIQVFEHQVLKIGQAYDGIVFEPHHFLALERLYGEKGVPFFSLIHKGVRFCEYVGAIQVADLLIQVLPKADRSTDKVRWHKVLIGMLRAINGLDVLAPSSAGLALKSNSILDLYIGLFISEVERLLHQGLIRTYRRIEGNRPVLKGRLLFSKNIQLNLTHQERFYTNYTTYDKEGILNRILLTTLQLLGQLAIPADLRGRLGTLLLQFPELDQIKAETSLFERLVFSRKTAPYQKAIGIARLLLLNYHPDLQSGREHVLALLFDMNVLWERFVFVTLRRYANDHVKLHSISAQSDKDFWKPEQGRKTKIRPDILLMLNGGKVVVLDTKWKNLNGSNPSAQDLRQLYVYSRFHNNANAALIYPGEVMDTSIGKFLDGDGTRCGVIIAGINDSIASWQQAIAQHVFASELFQ